MSINQLSFLISFAGLYVVLALLQFLRMHCNRPEYAAAVSRGQLFLLLIYSYGFLAQSAFSFAAVVFAETVWVYVCGILIGRAGRSLRKPWQLALSILLPAGLLLYFKYYNFFAEEMASVLGLSVHSLSIIAPVGISFYTFTAIGYLADVYRGEISAETDPLSFALFISFFPKIISGPIVRAGSFLPQVRNYEGLRIRNLADGLQIFVFGLFKKMVLADHLGVFVDDVFRAPSAYSTATVWLAALSYSLQIYYDFSGYSDMACGLSRMLGLELPRNFNLPYLSRNVSEFWSRWHISLSGWLRDYIYFPLGGSRKGRARTYVNLLLVMLFSGLWHGAGYTFLLWGLGHGILSCLHHFREEHFPQQLPGSDSRDYTRKETLRGFYSTGSRPERSPGSGYSSPGPRIQKMKAVCSTLTVFLAVTLLWVVFRAESLSNMTAMFVSLFTLHGGIRQPYAWTFLAMVVLTLASAAAMISCRKNSESGSVNGFYPVLRLDTVPELTLFFLVVGVTILLGYYGDTSFIYGKF